MIADTILNFLTIFCSYSRGDKVKGAYHCQFGVVYHRETKDLVRGLEKTDSVRTHFN